MPSKVNNLSEPSALAGGLLSGQPTRPPANADASDSRIVRSFTKQERTISTAKSSEVLFRFSFAVDGFQRAGGVIGDARRGFGKQPFLSPVKLFRSLLF